MKIRKMPSWLASLREKNFPAYQTAIKRGGQCAAKLRKYKQKQAAMEKSEREYMAAELADLVKTEAAWYAALQRRDHLLPPEDNDLAED